MIDVCFGILMELLNKQKVTAQYLSEKFEISQRTVYRYIDKLSFNHIPVFTSRGRNGGIQIADNYRLRANYLTKDEQSDIITALNILEKTKPNVNSENIKNKLLAMHDSDKAETLILDSHKFIIEGGLMGDALLYRSKIEPLLEAIDNTKIVSIVYHSRDGEISTRDIEPHAFVLKDLVWYVYGYCLLRKSFRMFKISRIEKLKMLDTTFKKRSKDEYTPWKLDFNNSFTTVNLLLGVNNAVRYDVEEWLGIECVSKSANADWPYTASAKVQYDGNLIPRLLSFGNNIKILSPIAIRDKALSIIGNIAEIYK